MLLSSSGSLTPPRAQNVAKPSVYLAKPQAWLYLSGKMRHTWKVLKANQMGHKGIMFHSIPVYQIIGAALIIPGLGFIFPTLKTLTRNALKFLKEKFWFLLVTAIGLYAGMQASLISFLLSTDSGFGYVVSHFIALILLPINLGIFCWIFLRHFNSKEYVVAWCYAFLAEAIALQILFGISATTEESNIHVGFIQISLLLTLVLAPALMILVFQKIRTAASLGIATFTITGTLLLCVVYGGQYYLSAPSAHDICEQIRSGFSEEQVLDIVKKSNRYEYVTNGWRYGKATYLKKESGYLIVNNGLFCEVYMNKQGNVDSTEESFDSF